MDANIAEVLEELARSQPEAPAIHAPGRKTLRYADLGEQICYVRERLIGWGIQPGDVVGAAIPSRPEMAVAIATLPSSCTLAPLDPTLPRDVYAELLRRMSAKAVLVTAGPDGDAIRGAARVLGIAEINVTPAPDAAVGLFTLALGLGGPALATGSSGDPRLAYILTSSGTTGRPKLVPTEHRAMLCYARAIRDWLDFTPDDVGVHITPVYLGNGLGSGLLNALLEGRSLALLPVGDIEAFFTSIEEFQPTFLIGNLSLFRGILQRAPEFRAAVAQSRFRFMRWAGRVDLEDADRLEQLFEAPMLTGLSSTETWRISHDPLPPRRRKRGSVGLPVVNEVALLDGAGNIRSHGGQGEIVVRGPMVFRGYLDDPDLTAAAFVGDWFRTGDLGRIDEDGYVYFVGRIKDIINRGGEKILPFEIDLAIESLPGVKEAAAFGIPHPTLGEEMVAAVVREENAAVDEAQVVERVRARAGVRKVPRRVYFVERLPRTDNGKLRRSTLPEMLSLEQVAVTTGHAPPATGPGSLSPFEGALAGLWSSLLQVGTVGRNDDFFLLGGDSLRGMQLIAHLKTIFGVDLPLLSLFGDAATVAGMAHAIETIRTEAGEVDRRPNDGASQAADAAIHSRRNLAPVPLAHAQLRVWFLAQLDPESRAYNVAEAHRITGPIDVAALHESLQAVVQRHEILRTAYVLVDSEPRQVVQPAAAVDFHCLDLPTDDQEDILLKIIDREEQRQCDLERGPAVRFRLIRLANGDHVLLRVWHHIVWDGWSMSVFDRELSALYAAIINRHEPKLPALPIQYADYAVWQREWLQGAVLEQQLAYWKARLAGAATLELPTDRPRPPVLSSRGARAVFDLSAPLVPRLKELGRREGATLFMTLLAVFQVLLARYSGQSDIVVGAPIAGRRRIELEGLIGFFANTLVLRSDLSGNPGFRELLERVRENALSDYAHQDLPFERLVEELAPARDLSRNPLFQVSFALQNNPAATLQLEGLQVRRVALPRRNVKFDLSLAVREVEQGLRATWEYSTDLFDAATIARMAEHFQVLLAAIVGAPDQGIDELPLLTEAERQQLLVDGNATATDYPRDRCVHQLVEAQAARTPDAVAVVDADQSLTYAALNARANQLAHHLIAHGVGPEVLVGICLERSLDLVVGLLGVLKAGGAYVPLDPSYPPARLAFMLTDTQASVLVTQRALLAQLPAYAGRVLCLDRDAPAIAAQSCADPPCRPTAESLAYVIYTSGSTGTPKGVMVTHGNVARLFSATEHWFHFDPHDVWTCFHSSAFDFSVWEIWGALIHGGKLIMVPYLVSRDPHAFHALLDRERVTVLSQTPSAFRQLMAADAEIDVASDLALRVVILGGEALQMQSLRAWFDRHGDVRPQLVNMYGITETTVHSTYRPICRMDVEAASGSLIGVGIPDLRVHILDRHLQPVPLGVAGEIAIGGAGVARGYLNREALTAERFVTDPFNSDPHARLYLSGDRARRTSSGDLEYLGRLDAQLKIRGFRIEPGEVEAVLGEHPAVRQAVVLAREDTPADKRLVAYVVPTDKTSSDIDALRALVRTRLPEYMHPSAYVVLEALPLTSNGKLDRHALPAPRYGAAIDAFVAPRDALENAIGEVWREVLGIEQVGLHSNFFEVGGHSLLATQVVARLSELLQVELPVKRMFEAPTIAELAAEVVSIGAGSDESELGRILREVESLSDDEVARQLDGERSGGE
jgi:amino acid adenylation domain-containing protein